ncbi:hypothetical protein, partial [Pseudomonas aeruginosa]|uniref:hypothetical protein n=1 Tax=Pseudomonas aeruginosa TaxID=287 RepID=UPI0027D43AA7
MKSASTRTPASTAGAARPLCAPQAMRIGRPLAVGLRPEQSVEWRLRQVGHDLLELLEHQDVPLECVTQALRQRGASGLPIRIACG